MSFSPSTSSSSSFAFYPKIIDELESKWSQSMPEALKFFDKICHDVEDDGQRQEATKFVANKIQTASVYRRTKIFEELGKTSVMCRIYLSHEFQSVQDSQFPRTEIFYRKLRLTPTPVFLHPEHSLTKVFGNNAQFNLGISNDAKPVKEMSVLNVPQCRKIKMSNSHTLFVTHGGKAYGCGKASLLRIDGEESTDEYFKEPTLLRIPSDEFVEDILAEENGSVILTNKFMYVIGSVNIEATKQKNATVLSANCKRFVLVKEEGQDAKIRSIDFWCSRMWPGPVSLPEADEIELKTSSGKVKVRILNMTNYLMFSLPSVSTKLVRCRLVLNGRLVENENVTEYYISPYGKIVMKLKNEILVKGRLEIVRLKKPVRLLECKEYFSEDVMAYVDEIPGSYGVETFCCSPDLKNCIFQIGQTERKLMHSFREDLADERYKIMTEEHQKVKKALTHTSPTETLDSFCKTLERIITLLNENCSAKVRRRNPSSSGLLRLQVEVDTFFRASVLNDFRIHRQETYDKKQIAQMIQTTLSLIQCRKNEISDSNIQQFASLARAVENLMAEEPVWPDDEEENEAFQYDCRNMFSPSVKTVNIEKIVNDRVKSGELEPKDIPIDLKITVAEGPDETKFLISKTNQTLFGLMYPNWAEKIENGYLYLTGSYIHNYFFKRFDFLAAEKVTNWNFRLPDVARQIVKITPDGKFLWRLMPKTPITDFAGPKTSSEDIWFLESSDGNRIPVHKFLILLHSRRAQTSQRFSSMQWGSNSENQERVVIKTSVTSDVIEIAMRALLDMSTLYDKNIDEVVAVLMFYDYHLMEEALDDGIQTIFQMFNDSNLDILYWLFDKFEQRIIPHLLKHNRLILMSASEHIPPREFIKRFSELVSYSLGSESEENRLLKPKKMRKLNAEDVMRHMMDSAADRDESLLKAFADEWEFDFETVRAIQMSSWKKWKKPREGERKSKRNKKPRLV